MKALKWMTVFGTVLWMVSCHTPVKVYSDYLVDSPGKQFTTFRILTPDWTASGEINPIQFRRVEKALLNSLEEVGFTASELGDFQVAFFLKTKTVRQVNTYNNGYGFYRWGYRNMDINVEELERGTLVLHILDPNSEEVIWFGEASGIDATEPVQLDKQVKEATDKLVRKFIRDFRLNPAIQQAPAIS